jgi:hypothetical protein
MTNDHDPSDQRESDALSISHDELHRLINLLFDDQLSPHEAEMLQIALMSSDENRELYMELVDTHALLAWQNRWPLPIKAVFAASELTEEDLMKIELTQLDVKPFPVVPSRLRDRRSLSQRKIENSQSNANDKSTESIFRRFRLPLAIAASLMLMIFGLPRLMRNADENPGNQDDFNLGVVVLAPFQDDPVEDPPPVTSRPTPVATLTSVSAPTWNGKEPLAGDMLYQGESLHLEQGQALISFGFGAEVLAKAPCRISFVSKRQVQLSEGRVFVDVARWGKGFTVLTSTTKVVDLGTTFSVSVIGGVTETSVQKGMVRLDPIEEISDGTLAMLVPQGRGVSVGKKGQRTMLREVPSDVPRDLSFGALSPLQTIPMPSTGLGLNEGDADANWQIVARDGEDYEEPMPAQVCVPNVLYLKNDPANSQWVSMSGWKNAELDTVYTFRTNFDLTGYDLSTTRVFCRLLADDQIREVRVNGQTVQGDSVSGDSIQEPIQTNRNNFIEFPSDLIEVTDFLTRDNLVEIDVHNAINRDPLTSKQGFSPMALRVQWHAFGRKSPTQR